MSNKVNLGWLQDASGERIAPKTFMSQVLSEDGKTLDKVLDKTITSPLYAEVGQQLIVKKVDENGKPIDWEYVERPCYIEEAELIFDKKDITLYPNGYSSIEDKYYYAYNFEDEERINFDYEKLYLVETNYGSSISECYSEGRGDFVFAKYENFMLEVIDSYIQITTSESLDSISLDFIKISEIVFIKQIDKAYIPELFIKKPYNNGSYGYVLMSNGYGGTYWGQVNLSDYVKNTQYATSNQAGLVRTNTSFGTSMYGQYIQTYPATQSDIDSKSNTYRPITPKTLDYAVRAGLGNSSLTWNDEEKTKARNVIGAVGKDDVSQSDYNQSDATKVDYIKNKPFYEEEITDIVAQSTIYSYTTSNSSSSIGNSYFCRSALPTSKYIVGEEYEVSINNNIHSMIFKKQFNQIDASYFYGFGLSSNDAYESPNSDGEHDFMIYMYSYSSFENGEIFEESMNCYFKSNNYTFPITVSISKKENKFKQLDEKFIPDNIPKVSTASVGQLLSVKVVDENGKPIEWETISIEDIANQVKAIL